MLLTSLSSFPTLHLSIKWHLCLILLPRLFLIPVAHSLILYKYQRKILQTLRGQTSHWNQWKYYLSKVLWAWSSTSKSKERKKSHRETKTLGVLTWKRRVQELEEGRGMVLGWLYLEKKLCLVLLPIRAHGVSICGFSLCSTFWNWNLKQNIHLCVWMYI